MLRIILNSSLNELYELITSEALAAGCCLAETVVRCPIKLVVELISSGLVELRDVWLRLLGDVWWITTSLLASGLLIFMLSLFLFELILDSFLFESCEFNNHYYV